MLRLAPKLITVDRSSYNMQLWKMSGNVYLKKVNYNIAIGAIGHETPTGMYFIQGKSKTPDWRAPDADWVPVEKRGKVFPIDDPTNPFAGGFISIANTDGVGFHGTKFDPQLGSRASHGCIRMSVSDFLDFYDRADMHTPVFIY